MCARCEDGMFTFSASHGVEEELLRGEPSQIGVLHEPSGLWPKVILRKVRQRAVPDAQVRLNSVMNGEAHCPTL